MELDPILKGLDDIHEKIVNNLRLNRNDGLKLIRSTNLLGLGYLANERRRAMTGDQVFYNNNAHINYSNVCKVRCGLCAFAKDPDEKGSYTMSIEEVVHKAGYFADQGVTELHIVGGIHPDLPFSYYLDMIRKIKDRAPQVSIKAFTAAEYDYFAQIANVPVLEILKTFKQAGLSFMTGGGAENFSPRVRDIICPGKLSGERWLEIHRLAHQLNIPTNANILYGIIETDEELIDHLLALRALQDETQGFYALIPTAFHPKNTKFEDLPQASAIRTLKVIAVARLILDNFRYIKAYWISSSPQVAQMALSFGANDLDGVVREEKIYHTAGASSPQMQTELQLISMIHELGLEAVERDTYYNVIKTLQPPSSSR
ncbi:CofH family radical SAM protein [Desulfosporosinus sp. BICA1-9]|uniref:radical SAM protein n=1 Tax=Desulfosporosinus sp. BICA1-9 TaxID=1531958 RepID=UPI00054C7563|nr:CofH family radical SAM protein [Desulfosporosinus sp. BICA1-9]KJS47692.1 MAG: radical SAM protein [Peptococcaceae bacterium BRH_c23]KJS89389.1 MAG: radical SAM protein [Desulfosporosinus sp. BICA1-9]HBW36747.1 CofH family radical SAM protein [Desulfosporosinus sp.]